MGRGSTTLAGVDEAGRGALAGPVVAAAVMLPCGETIEGLNDSKLLSRPFREALAPMVKHRALAWGTGTASVAEIEELNILQATFLAMRRAIDAMTSMAPAPGLILVDGPHPIAGLSLPQKPIVKGDSRSINVAAASVLAKTTRDALMRALDGETPGFGFATHMGYGTQKHMQALRERGLSIHHRPSFCRKIVP